MSDNKDITGNLHGEKHKPSIDIKEAEKKVKLIEKIVEDMREMNIYEFLAMCRVIVQSNYDLAYPQLKSILRIDEINKESEKNAK